MSVFKQSYTDRKGKVRQTNNFNVEFVFRDRSHRIPAFTDEAASSEFERKLLRLGSCCLAAETIDAPMTPWLEGLPSATRK
jgi:hypothetical protein